MEIKTVWGMYFSPTGTTKKVVSCISKTVAEYLGVKYKFYPFNLPETRTHTLYFSSDDLIVCGVPVYAGRVPNKLLPFLKKHLNGNGAFAVPVTLFGNRDFDDALIELRNLLQEANFHTISAAAFVGEHSFSRVLAAGRPNENDMKLAANFANETAEKVLRLSGPPKEPVSVKGNDPIHPYYTPRDHHGNAINILGVKPKTDMKKCTSCGLCARICTMGAINSQDVSEVVGACIKCCACIKKCPCQAKYFDDERYLYHQHDLEKTYEREANIELFY